MLISIFAFIYNKCKYLLVQACFYFLLFIHIFESFDIFSFSNIRLFFLVHHPVYFSIILKCILGFCYFYYFSSFLLSRFILFYSQQ